MADEKVKVTKLPYMGPPKDDSKEKERKRVGNTMPLTSGTSLAVPMSPEYRDRNYAKGGDVQSESSKLDQANAAKDKMQDDGYKRYQAEQKREAEENAAPRKAASEAVGKSFDYVKKGLGMKSGGKVSSASSRADGCAQRGKTRGRMV
jgi:hypothetical protein